MNYSTYAIELLPPLISDIYQTSQGLSQFVEMTLLDALSIQEDPSGKFFYENQFLGIRIDLWPAFYISMSFLLLLYLWIIGIFDKDNYDVHHASHGYGARLDHYGHHHLGFGGGGYKSAIDRLHARVHALQEENYALQGALFDSWDSWEEEPPSITSNEVNVSYDP